MDLPTSQPAYRLADRKDVADILDALERLNAYAKSYPWITPVDWDKGSQYIIDQVLADNAYVVDGYLVMVNVVSPWYSADIFLQEWLVLKLHKGGKVTSVPEALKHIAKSLGCSMVVSADSSPVNLVGFAYEGAGYQPLTRSFFIKV